jgi:endonuclease/exonuclease/phosphatase (EEP) superfamily protein YafD
MAGWAAARLAGADRLRFAEAQAVPLLSFTPQAAAGAWISALLLRGAGPAAVTAAAAAALTVAVGPRAVPYRQPGAAGPVLRVLTANLLVGRASAEAVTGLVRRKHADVLFVQELTSEAADRLERAGLGDLLPHRVTQPVPHGTAGSIYARYPLRGGPPAAPAPAVRCTARLDLPSGLSVQLACIHAAPPKPPWSPGATARWRSQLATLPAPGYSPCVLAGDFNATLDHAQFRQLLRRGYADAASRAGHGLSPTWGPRPGRRPALLAIDHVLTSRGCAVLATSAGRLTGSDHRALYAEIRLLAPHSRPDQALRLDSVHRGVRVDHVQNVVGGCRVLSWRAQPMCPQCLPGAGGQRRDQVVTGAAGIQGPAVRVIVLQNTAPGPTACGWG